MAFDLLLSVGYYLIEINSTTYLAQFIRQFLIVILSYLLKKHVLFVCPLLKCMTKFYIYTLYMDMIEGERW